VRIHMPLTRSASGSPAEPAPPSGSGTSAPGARTPAKSRREIERDRRRAATRPCRVSAECWGRWLQHGGGLLDGLTSPGRLCAPHWRRELMDLTGRAAKRDLRSPGAYAARYGGFHSARLRLRRLALLGRELPNNKNSSRLRATRAAATLLTRSGRASPGTRFARACRGARDRARRNRRRRDLRQA
jgi:hypothetical protein